MKNHQLKRAATVVLAAGLIGLAGCATTQKSAQGGAPDAATPREGPGARLDPWEKWNRKVFAFNEGLDEHFLKPIATGYSKIVPQFVRRGIDNFFNNAADGWSAINNVLQGKGEPAADDWVRFTTNTVFGIFGIIDIASDFGIEHHYEDFGQTLGVWGFGPGAYIVLPLLGPSDVRDAVALPLDRAASPALYLNDGRYQVGIIGLQIINTRAKLLGASQVIDDIALDKYTFIRDAYLQRRRSLVFDDNPPPEVPADPGAANSVPVPGVAASVPSGAHPSAPIPAAPASAPK